MTDSSLLPYNATKFEKDVEAAIRYNVNTDYLSGFKFDPVGDNVSLALSWEYSLGQINVENFKDRVVQGLKFYRLRGTPYALRLALSWYGFDDIGIEEEEPGEHFAEFQVDLKEVPNNLEVDKIVDAARSAAPLRSRLSRMYNELYDIRRFILDHSDWGDFLSDNSGYQPYEGAPKFSFGRVNTFQLAIEKPKLQYARSVKKQQMFLAWGSGEESWGREPPEEGLIDSTELIKEVGRRLCENVEFCTPDDEGDIITRAGRFSHSDEPTNTLHFTVLFDFEDAEGLEIREFGLFTDTVLKPDLPEGQKYFTPDLIEDKGTLLVIERVAPIYRQAMTREQENFVITF